MGGEHEVQRKNVKKSLEGQGDYDVSGLMLYAKTDEQVTPDSDYIYGGNRIGFKTLDLDVAFPEVAEQLNQIIDDYLGLDFD